MKILLMLSLFFWATVTAKTESDIKQQNLLAQNQKAQLSNVPTYISEADLKVKNILLTSHFLFDYYKSPHPLLIFDLSINSDNIYYSPNPLLVSNQKNKVKKQFSSTKINLGQLNGINRTSEKTNYGICWNRTTLTYYIQLISSKNNYSIPGETEQEKVNDKEFKYAGSERFTLSGDPPNSTTEIKPLQASIMGGIAIVTGIALHINQSAAWWDGKGRSFYIKDDWNNALFADKFGHFMGGYFASYISREAFVFSGFSWEQSIFLGSLLGLLAQTYVEFKDGYAENTGFSPSDFAADLAGVTYFYLQHYIPFLQNFSPKWQYTPPGMIGVPPKARTQTFLDNYNSTTGWVSIHVRNLFWGEKESFWPRWLNIGIGYGINGYYTPNMYSRFVIGIDYNIVELLPDGVPFWNWFKQSLNCIKFPAPAIEFTSQGTQFKLLYPFTISIGSVQF